MGLPTTQRTTEGGGDDARPEGKVRLAALATTTNHDQPLAGVLSFPTNKSVDRLVAAFCLPPPPPPPRDRPLPTGPPPPPSTWACCSAGRRRTSRPKSATRPSTAPRLPTSSTTASRSSSSSLAAAAWPTSASSTLDVNPFEVDIAVARWGVTNMWNILAGGGKGVGTGIGAPQMRPFANKQFNPDFRDRDHDGVYDVNDQVSRSAGRSRRLPRRRRLP